ncbi:unnamed protein product [Pleuronectes platessa]|uniref:Uncharacterized protein n=1 Tax=Pleuronectes platessa TaxID=8262 RepID=A0A9N7VQF8_PLEPL|nr:unnamed protein product [Pleuronectes platessa]
MCGCLRCVSHPNPWPLPPPPDGQTLSQGPVEVGALCLTACHCTVVENFFPQEMVSDWEQCVNSPVTLDKPARRPVTRTYGMFDRERGQPRCHTQAPVHHQAPRLWSPVAHSQGDSTVQ